MTIMTVRANAQRTSPPDTALASLVDAVGEDRFGPALARFLNELCGADHFAAFRFGKDELREVAAWRSASNPSGRRATASRPMSIKAGGSTTLP